MSRIGFLNGSFLPLQEAKISAMDRGFLFADGIYEGYGILDGCIIDVDAHLDRLEYSLAAIQLPNPYSRLQWADLLQDLVHRNAVAEGFLYLQVTRGTVADRDFLFPETFEPTVFMFTQAKPILASPHAAQGIAVISVPDLRWKRRDIKSVSLLAQVLAKQAAHEAGAQEAWMVEDGYVTEGGSSSAFIITAHRTLVVRPLSHSILSGITRQAMLKLVSEVGLSIEERRFTLEEAYRAHEAFLTSASNLVLPIVSIDGISIGNGRPGPITRRLRELYIDTARRRVTSRSLEEPELGLGNLHSD